MGKTGGWLGALGPAIGAVAGVMVAVGVYLLDPAVADLGFALNAERTWLVGAFLIAMGCALAFKLAWPKGLESGSTFIDLLAGIVLGDVSHFFYGLIAGALGVQALFAETPNYWVTLLLVPALLSFIIAFSEDDDEADEADGSEQDEAEKNDNGEEVEPESGNADLWGTAWVSLRLGGFFSLYVFAFMAVIGLAAELYRQLQRIIIDGETPDLSNPQILEMSLATLSTLALLAVGLALALAAVFFFFAIWPSRQATPEAKRAPRPADDAFIEASERAVRTYAKAQGYDRNNSHWDFFEFISLMAVIGVGAVVMFGGIAMLEAASAGPSFPLVLSPSGASAFVAFFAFILLGILPKSIWSRLSRRFSERAGWVLLRPKTNPEALRQKLVAFVRTRRLSTATPINPGEFLHAANLSGERNYFVPAAVLIVVALFLLHRDLNAADVLTEDAIEVTNYWTLATTRYGYGDVVKVELRCFLTDKNDPVEAYVLHLKDGQSLDIYKSQTVVERLIAAYEAIDAKLVAQGVPFVPGSHQGLFRRDERGYDADCVETLVKEFPEELRPRVKKLFHLDEMTASAGGPSSVTPP